MQPPSLGPEIPFLHCETRLDQRTVHLFGFPPTLSRDFTLEDLQFPMDFVQMGFIVILDMAMPQAHENTDPRRSAYTWACSHNLPLVVVTGSRAPDEELRSVMELRTSTPICRYSASFDGQVVQDVLRHLVRQMA